MRGGDVAVLRSGERSASKLTLFAAFFAIVLLFGINFVAVRISNRELWPLWAAGTRFAVAALILAVLVRVRGIRFPRGKALAGAFWFGVTAFALTYALIYYSLLTATAGAASVLFATVPLNTFWLAVAIRQERFRLAGLLGAMLVILGVAVAYGGGGTGDAPISAYVAAYGSALAAAVSGLVIKRFPRSHPLATNAVAMAVGAALLLAASLAVGEPWRLPLRHDVQASFVWLVASSIGAFSLMVWLLARWTASAVSYAGVLAPFVAVVAGAVLADEIVAPRFLLGAVVVIAGVWVGALWKGRVAAPRPAEAQAAFPEPLEPRE